MCRMCQPVYWVCPCSVAFNVLRVIYQIYPEFQIIKFSVYLRGVFSTALCFKVLGITSKR